MDDVMMARTLAIQRQRLLKYPKIHDKRNPFRKIKQLGLLSSERTGGFSRCAAAGLFSHSGCCRPFGAPYVRTPKMPGKGTYTEGQGGYTKTSQGCGWPRKSRGLAVAP
jgi:hypothetical protein